MMSEILKIIANDIKEKSNETIDIDKFIAEISITDNGKDNKFINNNNSNT